MGCTACFGDKKVFEPAKNYKPLKIVILQKQLTHLKPNSIILQEQFFRLHILLRQYCQSYETKAILYSNEDNSSNQNNQRMSYLKLLVSKWKLIILCQQLTIHQKLYDQFNQSIHHQCFKQIQKDIDRTFPQHSYFQSNLGIITFKRVLKRISTYFPKVGYTQGINFIVGYLLILGFEEKQAFWFTINIALNKKYLLLGLFQDGFPLSSIYCRLFNYMFKKRLPKLYQKFNRLGVADQIWIFKWFMTYYLYSFPFEIVREIWDLVFMVGGMGLIYFGLGVVQILESQLIDLEDDSQIANFLSGLKDYDTFNHYINLSQLLHICYSMQISSQSIQKQIKCMIDENSLQLNFYLNFFSNIDSEVKSDQILNDWYESLSTQRNEFQKLKFKQKQLHQTTLFISYQSNKCQQVKKQVKIETNISETQTPIPQLIKKRMIKLKSRERKKQDYKFNNQKKQQSIKSKLSLQTNKQNQLQSQSQDQIVPHTQKSQQSVQRFNNSFSLNAFNPGHVEQISQIQIFNLNQKGISFKKKKNEENSLSLRNQRNKRIKRSQLGESNIQRAALRCLQNEQVGNIDFEISQNTIMQGTQFEMKDEIKQSKNEIWFSAEQSIQIQSIR